MTVYSGIRNDRRYRYAVNTHHRTYFVLIAIAVMVIVITGPQNSCPEDLHGDIIRGIINDCEQRSAVDADALKYSERLGISYKDIKNKHLISYDIDPDIKAGILSGKIGYKLEKTDLQEGYKKLRLVVNGGKYTKDFYFKNMQFTVPLFYHTRRWNKRESKYVRYITSDPSAFSAYSIKCVDGFIENILTDLTFSDEARALLESEKIIYFLCSSQDEVKLLTGFNTRGMYLPAYDCIVSEYNAHYHELAHLLINYKLKNLYLYTPLFISEGFAVAAGGRGGEAREVMLRTGAYLEKAGISEYSSIMSDEGFRAVNESISYPAAGLYNAWVIKEKGFDAYLELYKTANANGMVAAQNTPTGDEGYHEYMDALLESGSIGLSPSSEKYGIIYESKAGIIGGSEKDYRFRLKGDLLIRTEDCDTVCLSMKYRESYPEKVYAGEKYLIDVDDNEVSIYNLLTNTRIAAYFSGLSYPRQGVIKENGYYSFYADRSLFDENLDRAEFE